MDHYRYMELTFDIIPQGIIYEYNLTEISHIGKVYIDILKGVYCFPKAGIIARNKLKNHLEKHGYQPVKFTSVLWTQKFKPMSFALIVYYFVIDYVGKTCIASHPSTPRIIQNHNLLGREIVLCAHYQVELQVETCIHINASLH